MPLQGTFDVLDFASVLELLASRKMSGRLHVRSRSFAANLFMSDGLVIGADQSEHQAAAVTGDVAQRVEEICFELLGVDRGNFEFHPTSANAPVSTAIPVEEVLSHARQRLVEWQELQVLIPSLDLQPRLVTELDPGEVTLDREQWRVLTVVDGRRNLRSIGRTLNLSDFEVCRAMRELLNAKVIELDTRSLAVAGLPDLDPPLTTEQVTINGKKATRLKTDESHGRSENAGAEGGDTQTIVISPTRHNRTEPQPPDVVSSHKRS